MSNGSAASPSPVSSRLTQARTRQAYAAAGGSTLAKTSVYRVDIYEMALYFCAFMVGSFAFLLDRDFLLTANTVVPVLLILALGWGCLRMSIRQVETILTPIFVMRVAILFYGGLGSLVPIYGGDDTRAYIDSFFTFTDEELLKYNVVVLVFTISYTFSSSFYRIIVGGILNRFNFKSTTSTIEPSNLSMPVVAFSFLTLGAFSKYFVILPFQFGLIEGTFPLFLAQIALLENIGLFLSLVWALRNRPPFVPLLIGYGIMVSLLGVLTFSKLDVVFPIIMVLAAIVYVRPTFARIGMALAIILFVFNTIQPVASHGRAWLNRCCASIAATADFSERFFIIGQYFEGNVVTDDDGVNYALVRFSYANVGTYIVGARDSGWQGDTLKYVFSILIPRVVWPDKPAVTDISRDLNVAITGNANSSVAPGFAAEGYWDGGWPGVVLMGFAVGLICYLWSLYSLEVQRVGAWHLFVIVLLGIRMGTRSDGFFVLDVIGPLGYAMVGHLIIMLLNRALAPRR